MPIRQNIQKLLKGSLVKNLTLVTSGTATAQIVTILAMPILTRQYTPESFGAFGLFMAISSMLGTICTGRYNIAVALTKKTSSAINAAGLSVLLACIFSVICLIGSLIYNAHCANCNSKLDPALVLLLPVAVIFLGLQQTYAVWTSRAQAFKVLAVTAIIGAVLGNTYKIAVGYADSLADGFDLIIGSLITTISMVVYQAYKNPIFKTKSTLSLTRITAQAKRFSDLPLFRAPKDLLNSAAQNQPTIILAALFGPQLTGYYILAEKLLKLPSVIVGNATRRVLLEKFARNARNQQPITPTLIMTSAGMATLAIPPFSIIALWGESLIPLFLGSDWIESGEYSRWVAIWMCASFIAIPSTVLIPILKLERLFLGLEIFATTLKAATLIGVATQTGDATKSVAAFCLVSAAYSLISVSIIIRYAKKRENAHKPNKGD